MLTDMKVFSKYLVTATIETVCQDINKFNQASGGAIVLNSEGFDGDFFQKTMFASLHTARRRVDRYAANGAVAATPLTQIQENAVKVAGGFGPVLWEESQLTWIAKDQAGALAAISKTLSEAIIQDQLNTAILTAVAAIGEVTLLNVTAGVDGVSHKELNNSHALFGDRSSAIVADIMTGATAHALIGENIANGTTLFTAGNVTVLNILGKVTIVTDSPALVDGANGKVLSLVAGGVVISDAGDLISNIETSNGNQRIETTFQVDYTFGVAIKGFSWDTATGGKSPLDAELGTGTNWVKFVSCDKDTAGTLLTFTI